MRTELSAGVGGREVARGIHGVGRSDTGVQCLCLEWGVANVAVEGTSHRIQGVGSGVDDTLPLVVPPGEGLSHPVASTHDSQAPLACTQCPLESEGGKGGKEVGEGVRVLVPTHPARNIHGSDWR